MKYNKIRIFSAISLMLIMLLSLSACGDDREIRYQTYVDSLITANYLNSCEQYVRSTGANQDDADAMYLQNVTRLANNLESFYGLEISSDVELAPKMVELAKKIYSKARFHTDPAVKDNNIYYVTVTIEPINLLNQTHDEVLAYVEDFNKRVENGDYNNYVKEDYEHEFAAGIIDILDKASDKMEYGDPVTIKVRIILSDSNFYISNEDFRNIDMAILSTDASKYEKEAEAAEVSSDTDADENTDYEEVTEEDIDTESDTEADTETNTTEQ
ncbi:MAG: hypothetical protein J6O17_09500 [Eubacterium sp.]|nr:hypothetical protein [Eubacterium sp.]